MSGANPTGSEAGGSARALEGTALLRRTVVGLLLGVAVGLLARLTERRPDEDGRIR
ncbi:hypothetical protein [Euzebya tangerina]|uniref:hypothetical protein n=1 Tax=Euzebya tangerina TaxID=591198 RepID=UPI0013C31F58|nr:hypothetical protein [Euzebya tangerina]